MYLAQYPIYTYDTLVLLEEALIQFHENKSIFVDMGINDSFNLPKLYFAKHYIDPVKLFGTTNNYNTEYMESLHIDLAKHAYAATNYKDEFTQMTIWLERKEKVHCHEQYIQWRQVAHLLLCKMCGQLLVWNWIGLYQQQSSLIHVQQLWIALNWITVRNISRLLCVVIL